MVFWLAVHVCAYTRALFRWSETEEHLYVTDASDTAEAFHFCTPRADRVIIQLSSPGILDREPAKRGIGYLLPSLAPLRGKVGTCQIRSAPRASWPLTSRFPPQLCSVQLVCHWSLLKGNSTQYETPVATCEIIRFLSITKLYTKLWIAERFNEFHEKEANMMFIYVRCRG